MRRRAVGWTSIISLKRAVARRDFRRLRWLLFPLGCITFPLPVMWKRRLAPLWVLSLGKLSLRAGRRRLSLFPGCFRLLGRLLGRRWGRDHAHEAAFHGRRPFERGDLLQLVVHAIQEVPPDLGV